MPMAKEPDDAFALALGPPLALEAVAVELAVIFAVMLADI